MSDCTISKEEMNEAVCESCEKLFWDENKCECKCHTGFQQTVNQCWFNVGTTSLNEHWFKVLCHTGVVLAQQTMISFLLIATFGSALQGPKGSICLLVR